MKIIFDTEEQKEEFVCFLIKKTCPGGLKLEESCENSCKKCWEKAIEMEVRTNKTIFEDDETLKIVAFKMAIAGICMKELGMVDGKICNEKCADCWERAFREHGEVKEKSERKEKSMKKMDKMHANTELLIDLVQGALEEVRK